MKTKFVSLLSCLLTLLAACTQNEKTEVISKGLDEFKVPKVLVNAKIENVLLPDYTTATYIDESTVEFQLPKNVKYFYQASDGTIHTGERVAYECTCSQAGSGCNVFYINDNFACSECSGACTGKRVERNTTLDVINSDMIFLDFNAGVKFVNKNLSTEKLYQATSFFFEIKQVKDALQDLNKKYYGTAVLSEDLIKKNNAQIVGLNVYGVLIGYALPVNYLTNYYAKPECDCRSGSTGCERKWNAGAGYWCEGGDCTTCRMTVNAIPSETK